MSLTALLVDTTQLLDACLNEITSKNVHKLAVDLEGVDLSRNGRIAIVQIFAKSSSTVWMIDVTILGRDAFTHRSANGCSLKRVLENDQIVKVMYLIFF